MSWDIPIIPIRLLPRPSPLLLQVLILGQRVLDDQGNRSISNDITSFTDGYAITKWKKHVTNTGVPGSTKISDIDFPMFRLADVYLMYAEAVLRGGSGGDLNAALTLVNDLRSKGLMAMPEYYL